MRDAKVAMVLSGGVALGAYQAGAYARMHETHGRRLHRLAGSSIGVVNAAIMAGNEPAHRVERLDRFWKEAAAAPATGTAAPRRGPWRHALNWASVVRTRTVGRTPFFRPRTPAELFIDGTLSVYDLSPLGARLEQFVDFNRLNGGDVRLSVVTTDVATGEAVVFDTAAGNRIEPIHLLASCGFLPEFQPVEIGGRLLGDGGLVANAPVDVVLGDQEDDEDLLCFVVELFARDGGRPASVERAAERRLDLLMSSPTHRALDGLRREHRLRRLLAEATDRLPSGARSSPDVAPVLAEIRRASTAVLHLSYGSAPEEAGPEKQFDFSPATLADRWDAGERDMATALELLECPEDGEDTGGFTVHHVRRRPR